MTNSCDACGSPAVRKVTAVVNAGTATGYLRGQEGGAGYSQSTTLADHIRLPDSVTYSMLLIDIFAKIISVWIGMCVGLFILGFILSMIFPTTGEFIGKAGTADGIVPTIIVSMLVLIVAIVTLGIIYRMSSDFLSQRRARTRRLHTFDQEWYCSACDSVFVPGDLNSIRPASQANDYS